MIRDPLGTGLGAKPICNTDVFCVAPPDLPPDAAARRACCTRAGARRGSSPGSATTATGWASRRSTAPCSSTPATWPTRSSSAARVGVIPRGKPFKSGRAGRPDRRGRRPDRPRRHPRGDVPARIELTPARASVSGGAVQIGNAITEKMVLDVILQARDRGLFRVDHRLRRRRLQLGRRRDGREPSAPRSTSTAPRSKYEGLVVHRDLDLRGPGADGPGRPAGERGASSARSARARTSRRPSSARSPATGRLTLRYHGERRSATCRWTSCTTAGRGRPGGRVHCRRPSAPTGSPRPDDSRRRPARDPRAIRTSAARSGSSASTTTRSRARTVVKPLVGVRDDGPGDAAVSSCRSAGRRAAWRSAAGSTRATASSTRTRWPPA